MATRTTSMQEAPQVFAQEAVDQEGPSGQQEQQQPVAANKRRRLACEDQLGPQASSAAEVVHTGGVESETSAQLHLGAFMPLLPLPFNASDAKLAGKSLLPIFMCSCMCRSKPAEHQ